VIGFLKAEEKMRVESSDCRVFEYQHFEELKIRLRNGAQLPQACLYNSLYPG
jgi:hypothetical protein